MPLQLKRRHGSPFWYIRGTVKGVSVDESTGLVKRSDAEDFRATRESEIIKRSIHGAKSTATFLEAAVSYMESGGERRFLQPIIAAIGEESLAKVNQVRIEKLARKLYPGRAPATLNRQVYAPISAILKHAHVRDLCDYRRIERLEEPKGRVRWLTPEEAERLIGECAAHVRPLVAFLFYTGARISEALYLDWRDVDLGRKHVQFHETKNGESRGVPLHGRVVVELARLKHRKGAVFRRADGIGYAEKASGGGQIKTAFRGACKRAGIENFTPHDCRHTWATWHYAANRDFLSLKMLGGWKTERMVFRYAHSNTAEQAHTIDRLPWGNTGEAIADKPETKKKTGA